MLIITQVIGTIGLILSLMIYQVNNRKLMLYISIVSALIWGIHYGMLGAWTGSAMCMIQSARNYVFSKKQERNWAKSIVWVYLFLGIFITLTIFTWEGIISLFPLMGITTSTIAFWMNNPKHIRRISVINSPSWFIYDFISKSYPGMIADVVIFISIIIGIIRFDILKRKEQLSTK